MKEKHRANVRIKIPLIMSTTSRNPISDIKYHSNSESSHIIGLAILLYGNNDAKRLGIQHIERRNGEKIRPGIEKLAVNPADHLE